MLQLTVAQLRVRERAAILPLVVVLRSILCGSAQRFGYWQLELRSSLCCGAQRKVEREDSGGLDWGEFQGAGRCWRLRIVAWKGKLYVFVQTANTIFRACFSMIFGF